jgi:hypothetical protein
MGRSVSACRLLTTRLEANAEAADCFYPVSRDRLTEVCRARAVGGEDAASDHTDGFVHYSCPSLAHFIALLCRPTRSCLPPGTDLIVIDSLSALLNHAFPRLPAQNAVPKASVKGETPYAYLPQSYANGRRPVHFLQATAGASICSQCPTEASCDS